MSPDGEGRDTRVGSFLVGGVLGAVGALAAVRRSRPRARRRATPAGLAAFEEAPCYRETLERERAGELEDARMERPPSDCGGRR